MLHVYKREMMIHEHSTCASRMCVSNGLYDVCDGGLRCGLLLRRSGTLIVVGCHMLTGRIKVRVVMSQVFVAFPLYKFSDSGYFS